MSYFEKNRTTHQKYTILVDLFIEKITSFRIEINKIKSYIQFLETKINLAPLERRLSIMENILESINSEPFETRLSIVETNIGSLNNEINNKKEIGIPSNILSKLKKATSQLTFIINGSKYIGSGFFYYEKTDDLKNGYFVTAAHCVMSIENNTYYRTTEAYLQNPITNQWTSINVNDIFIDGVADIALIKTGIDFTNYPEYCLTINTGIVNEGDVCYVVGNPGGYDEDSISCGNVRDSNYTQPAGFHITNSIYVNASGMGGNSGGPIVNVNGDVIGIYTFGLGKGYECFGGGSNQEVLQKTLVVLKEHTNNKIKLYLGIHWSVPNPFVIKKYYNNNKNFSTEGVYIKTVSLESPFNDILNSGDLLLSCSFPNGEILSFGNNDNQFTPGKLLYYPIKTNIIIKYIKNNTFNIITENVILNKTYNDVSELLDVPLQTGLKDTIIL